MAIYDRLYNKYLQQLHQTQLVDNPNNYRKLTPQQFMAYYANAAKEFKKYIPSITKGHPYYETLLIGRVLDNSGYAGYLEKLAKAVGSVSPEYRRTLQRGINNGIDPNLIEFDISSSFNPIALRTCEGFEILQALPFDAAI